MSRATARTGRSSHGSTVPADAAPLPDGSDPLDLAVAARGQRRSVRRFWRLVRESVRVSRQAGPRLFTWTVLLQLGTAVLLAAQVLVVQAVLAAVLGATQGGAAAAVVLPVLLLAVLAAAVSASGAVLANQQRLLGELVMRRTWQQMLDVAGSVDLRSFESPAFYDRLQRVETNSLTRPLQLSQGLVGLLGAVAGSVGISVAVVALEPVLLPMLLLSGIPMFLVTRRLSRAEFAFAVRQTPRLRLRHYLGSVQTGREEAKEVRAFNLATTLRRRFDGVYADYLRDLGEHVGRQTRLALAGNLASAVVLAATLLAVVWLVAQGRVDLAGAGAAIVAIRALATQVTGAFRGAQQIFESGLFLDDLASFTALRPAAERQQAGAPAPASFDSLTAEHVTFRYPGRAEPALDDVSMELHRGEVVALVGENGSGKTTLAKVLAGLYDPSEGAVRWDGLDTGELDRASVRESVAVVFQDFVRYQLSAADNIGFGRAGRLADRPGIVAAARRAGAAESVERLPAGYDTLLSRQFAGGLELSGGQWQRLALARAFFRDAPFAILDEPTAALDPRAEHDLFASLRALFAGRTVLFISHRFSTVRSADRIYVMDAGRILEHGTHEELLAREGRYAELFRLQAAAYLPEAHAGR